MISSMKNLLSRFPYFLDKREVSNFYKSESVFNNRFKGIYNDLYLTYLSFRLKKSLWIYREQEEDYEYSIHFYAFADYIKSVKVYKNNELIYTEEHLFGDEVNTFEYTYSSTSENKIPLDKFILKVETFKEYTLTKGYPENDTVMDNIYDHDYSLDNIGLFMNLPRKKYVPVHEYEYSKTEPPYHPVITDGGQTYFSTEDDYHYMRRLLNYISYYHDTPLPVLELWKITGVPVEDISIQNRDYLLCKMFEEKLHPPGWSPLEWEHKDKQCITGEGYYFLFVTVDNYTPFRGQRVKFNLMVLNSLGKKVTGDFIFLPFLDGVRFKEETINNYTFTVDTKDLSLTENNTFVFKAFTSQEALDNDLLENNGLLKINPDDLVSDEIIITIRGCSDGDWYVSSSSGNDNNSGDKEHPLQSLKKALSKVRYNDVIVLTDAEYHTDNILNVPYSCTIVGCAQEESVIKPVQDYVFTIPQDVSLSLINILLKKDCCELFAVNDTFINNNPVNNPVRIGLNRPVNCKKLTRITLNNIPDIDAGEQININGLIKWIDRRTHEEHNFNNATIHVLLNDEEWTSINSGNNGEILKKQMIDTAGTYTLRTEYTETEEYCGHSTSVSFRVYHITYLNIMDNGDLSFTTSHETLELTIDDATSDFIMTCDESENMDMFINTLGNFSGDIIVEDYL